METLEVIKLRRSVRSFTEQRVEREDLETIVEAGLWAPSATNRQPWYFLALTNDEDIEWLLVEQRKYREQRQAMLNARFPNYPDTVRETLGFMDTLGGTHALVLAFLRKDDYGEHQEACLQSVGAAMQNMVLAAADLGIASCWVEDIKRIDAEVHEHFGIEYGPLLGCVVLGYAAREARVIPRKPGRFDIR